MKGENERALPTTAFYLISHYGAGLPLNRYGSGAYAVNQQFSLYDAASDDQKFKLVTVNNKQRAAARVCGFRKLTLFSRFPERFEAKFEKRRRKAPCHNGLRRRFDRKSVRFIPL